MRQLLCRLGTGVRAWLAASAAFLLAGATAQPAMADGVDKSAFELHQQCETVTSRFLQGVCFGYLSAALTSHLSFTGGDETVCLPPDLRLEAVRRDFVTFVAGNRSLSDVPAHEAVVAMMRAAYPCDGTPAAGAADEPPDYGLSAGQD